MSEPTNARSNLPFQVGDRVKIRYDERGIARVIEYRGPLGPGGALVYRVRVGRKPFAAEIELLADQIVAVPADAPTNASKPKRRRVITPEGEPQ